MNIYSTLVTQIERLSGAKAIDQIGSRANLVEITRTGIKHCAAFRDAIRILPPATRAEMATKLMFVRTNTSDRSAKLLLDNYYILLDQVGGDLAILEKKTFGKCFELACVNAIAFAESILNQLERHFPDESIAIGNTTFTQTALVFLLRGVGVVGRQAGTWLALVQQSLFADTPHAAPWQVLSATDHTELASLLAIFGRMQSSSSDDILTRLNRAQAGMTITNELSAPNAEFLQLPNTDPSMRHAIVDGLSLYNPFRILGEFWILTKLWWIEWSEHDKRWLERRVLLLQLQLQGRSPDDPEYKRLVAAVDHFKGIIDGLAKRIEKYRNPEASL